MTTSHRMPQAQCPLCGYDLSAASNMTANNKPRSGDISVCIGCGNIMAFDKKLRLRPLTDDERSAVADDPRIKELETARRAAMLRIRS